MNQGFFGFPLSTNVRFLEKTTFDQSGIYEIPKNASTLLIYATGAGAGAAGGTSRSTGGYQGGSGGAAGAQGFITLFVDQFKYFFDIESNINSNQNFLPYKLVITIGAGGSGGNGGTGGGTGSNGSSGGDTVVSLYSTNAVSGNNIHRLLRLNGGTGSTTVPQRPIIHGIAATDVGGGRGASGTGSNKNVVVSYAATTGASWNGGAAGGAGSGIQDPGGTISLFNASLNTLLSLGPPNIPRKGSAPTLFSCTGDALGCENQSASDFNICGSLSPGFGAAGGWGNIGSNGLSGGRGFRGGGGGGGGGVDGTFSGTGGTGGTGGNGYVCIVALE